jgi:hypothetical protein
MRSLIDDFPAITAGSRLQSKTLTISPDSKIYTAIATAAAHRYPAAHRYRPKRQAHAMAIESSVCRIGENPIV